MQPYTSDEKAFIKMISAEAVETKQFFQLLVSENFFKKDWRPFMLVDSNNQQVILFFSQGQKYKEFPRFVNLVALVEDLAADRLIARVPVDQGNYFVGEFHDATEEQNDSGNKRYISQSTGRYIDFSDIHILRDRSGRIIARLEPVIFDDYDHFERFSKAFSGIVYPRESLKDLVNNKFRSVDQRRHRHTISAAWIAILLSLLFSSFSIYTSSEIEYVPAEMDCLCLPKLRNE